MNLNIKDKTFCDINFDKKKAEKYNISLIWINYFF